MTRSLKKRAISGITTARSDKPFKVAEHRRERHHVRQRLRVTEDDTDARLHGRPFGDPWLSPKDGKTDWTGEDNEKKMRRK